MKEVLVFWKRLPWLLHSVVLVIRHLGWRFAVVLLDISDSSVKAVLLATGERTPTLVLTVPVCFVRAMATVTLVTLRQVCVTASIIQQEHTVRSALKVSMVTVLVDPAMTASHVPVLEDPAVRLYPALRR